MIIKMPAPEHYGQMKEIWQQAFGDLTESVDAFFATGFRKEHSRVALEQQVLGAVYWFDLFWQGNRYAYLYALAVDAAQQGRGAGKALVEQVCKDLEAMGYAGAVLIPGSASLYDYYGKLGFAYFGRAQTITAYADKAPAQLQEVSAREYLQGRSGFSWDDAFAAFLENQCLLYQGDGIRLIRYRGLADIQEYMGAPEKLPGILAALDLPEATVCMPGGDTPAGMCRLFHSDAVLPDYLGPGMG